MTSQELKEPISSEEKDMMEEEQVEDNPDEMSPQQKFFYFARRGDVDGIKEVAKSVNVNDVDNIGFKTNPYISQNTALHYAVESGSLECVKVLYTLEAKLDATNKLQSTPLHIAASLGHAEITKYLIEMKANIEAKNIVQNTALHCAVYAGHVETVKVILAQLDDIREALLEPNGVGMGAAKYTAHDEMKALLRTYFPKKQNTQNEEQEQEQKENNNNNIEEEEEQAQDINDGDQTTNS